MSRLPGDCLGQHELFSKRIMTRNAGRALQLRSTGSQIVNARATARRQSRFLLINRRPYISEQRSLNMPAVLNLNKYREDILRIAREHGAHNIRVFGSVGRGDGKKDSDLDLLIDFEKGRSLLDLVGLKLDLEDLLGCSVDLATEDALHWTIRERVVEEARPL